MRYLYLVAIALVLTPFSAGADSLHIDRHLDSCIAADSTTAGMANCTHGAYQLWDQELNDTYMILMSSFTPAKKQSLRTSQRQWMVFRDAEFKAIDEMYKDKDGTMYIPMRALDRMEVVRSRVLQLQGYRVLADE
jgi:uncharacterized protein YecT (DUF1311 family)